MSIHTLFATALLSVFPIVSQAAATEESTPVRQQEVPAPAMEHDVAAAAVDDSRDGGGRAASGDGRDAGGRATQGAVAETAAETNIVPDNLQAARKADELPFSDIKILPSF